MKAILFLYLFLGVTIAINMETECMNGIYEGISEFIFSWSTPDDYYGNICTNKLGVRSLWAAAKRYCTSKEIEAGEKMLGGYCTKYGSVTLVPYSDVLPILTDKFINGLQVVEFPDINETKVWNDSVLLSPTLYQISRQTQVTFERQYELHQQYGWGVYGFWGSLLLIGILNRLTTHLFQERLFSTGDNIEGNARTRSAQAPTSPSPGPLKSIHHWFRANLIIPAAFGSHHQRPLWWATIPTRMEAVIVSAFWFLNLILCCVSYEIFYPNLYYTRAMQTWRYISDRSGIICYANLPWLWMFSGRNNIILWATGWRFSTFNIFHRHIARIATVEAIVHSIGYTVMEMNFHDYTASWKEKYWYMGAIATVTLSFLVIFSSKYIRTKSYEAFLILHIVLSVLTIVGLWYHTEIFEGAYDPYLWPLVAIWVFDRFIRLVRLVYCNIYVRLSKNLLTTKTTAVYDKDAEVIRLEPLKWNGWENHPFTLAGWSSIDASKAETSAPVLSDSSTSEPSITGEEKEAHVAPVKSKSSASSHERNISDLKDCDSQRYKLTFYLRVYSSWTRRLRSECLRSPKEAITTATFLVEGPYGETSPLHAYDSVLFIAGGTGITAVLPYLQDHLIRTNTPSPPSDPEKRKKKKALSTCTSNITLIWATKQSAFIRDVAARELRPSLVDREDIGARFCATARDESPSSITAETEKLLENATTDSNQGSKSAATAAAAGAVDISYGRPNVRAAVADFIDDNAAATGAAGGPAGRIAIFTCGPAGMADEAREAVHCALKEGKRGVEYFEESFG